MMDAHTEAGFIVGLPFAAEGVYDFAAHGDSTSRVAKLGAIMLQVSPKSSRLLQLGGRRKQYHTVYCIRHSTLPDVRRYVDRC